MLDEDEDQLRSQLNGAQVTPLPCDHVAMDGYATCIESGLMTRDGTAIRLHVWLKQSCSDSDEVLALAMRVAP